MTSKPIRASHASCGTTSSSKLVECGAPAIWQVVRHDRIIANGCRLGEARLRPGSPWSSSLAGVTRQLLFYGALGVLSTAFAFWINRRLFDRSRAGPLSLLEGLFYLFGVVSLGVGWYFNVRYVHQYGTHASYVNYTRALFDNWASDSAAQDYIIVNVALFPLWSIVDGRRRGIHAPWIFFVMSLFTSLAFAVAMYLAFVERQVRYNRRELAASSAA